MTRLRQFIALSGLTAVEAFRQPVTLLLFSAAMLLTGLAPFLLLHNFGESGKMVRDSALAAHVFIGSMLAAYTACFVMSREIRSGTASVVLSKPVGRWLFFGAKYAGVTGVVLFFSVCSCAGAMLAEKACEKFYFSPRIVGYFADATTGTLLLVLPAAACLAGAAVNIAWKKPFVSSSLKSMGVLLAVIFTAACFINEQGGLQQFNPLYDIRLAGLSLLIFSALCMVSALALAFSSRLNTVAALCLTFTVYLLGWMSSYYFGAHAESSAVAAALYGLLPDWQHLWIASSLSEGKPVSLPYIGRAAAYAVLYTGGVLAAGAVLFSDAELK